jgi:mannose-1-phosphate guanylyltransferase
VKPTSADTELGYIKIAKEIKEYPEGILYKVAQFKEKPSPALAKKYLSSWEYLWNTGYKIFSAKMLLSEFRRLYPELEKPVEEIIQAIGSAREEEVIARNWQSFPRLSIEYLLTDKLSKILVVPADLEWSDIGNWQKLHEVLAYESGHHMVVKGHHIGIDDENCLIYSEEKMIATLGLKDMVIVETSDVIFIAHKQHAHEVKKILEKLKEEGKYFYL